MATLQKIRSKGPLLLIVIGLAMLAFILGDAWKIIRPNQGIQYVGTIDGEDISAMDFQKELENYTEVVKFANQTNDLTEEQNNALRDEVCAIMVRNYILEKAAAQIGLTVTDEEVKEVIERGNDPVLTSTPFSQDGKFDADVLKSFLAFCLSSLRFRFLCFFCMFRLTDRSILYFAVRSMGAGHYDAWQNALISVRSRSG